jgi:hypothetical protein
MEGTRVSITPELTYLVGNQPVPAEEFYRTLALNELKRFAYDPQVRFNLFPEDAKVERARTDLRNRFESGKPIEIVVVEQETKG